MMKMIEEMDKPTHVQSKTESKVVISINWANETKTNPNLRACS